MDPYSVLGVSPSATHEEIRAAYMSLALKHHPDKSREVGSAELFTDINSAWGMVSDPTKRAELDRSKSIRNVGPVSDSVDLSEFTSSEPGVFTKSCRCGDIYEVFQTELDEGVNCIECNGCSLHVTINLN